MKRAILMVSLAGLLLLAGCTPSEVGDTPATPAPANTEYRVQSPEPTPVDSYLTPMEHLRTVFRDMVGESDDTFLTIPLATLSFENGQAKAIFYHPFPTDDVRSPYEFFRWISLETVNAMEAAFSVEEVRRAVVIWKSDFYVQPWQEGNYTSNEVKQIEKAIEVMWSRKTFEKTNISSYKERVSRDPDRLYKTSDWYLGNPGLWEAVSPSVSSFTGRERPY